MLLLFVDFFGNLSDSDLDYAQLPFGLPLPLLPQHVVSLTGDRYLQIRSYLFEFSESLCVLGSLPQAVQWGLMEAVSTFNVLYSRHEGEGGGKV